MLTIIANKLTKHLINSGVVSSELYEVYMYGFEVLLSSLFSTLLIIIIGIITEKFAETIFFLFVFISLRSFTGGFHANKYWICTILTFSIYIAVMLLSTLDIPSVLAYYVLFPIGVILLFIKAPILNLNKYLTNKEIQHHKVVSIVLFIMIALFGVLLINKATAISNTIYYTLIADLVLMFVKSQYVTTE